MNIRNFLLSREVFVSLFFFCIIAVPMVVFGGAKVVFVDKSATGIEDGTSEHPYQSISKALDNIKKGTEVRIKNGEYKENITIPKDVKLVGDSEKRDKVIIKARNENKPTVEMKDETEMSYVTVKGGRHGVRILSDTKAHLYNVVVKDSNRDGIHIDSAKTDKRHRVILDTVEVTRNDRTGIFAETRFITLINSSITMNKSDGVDFAMGTEVWLGDNNVSGNKGSGIKMVLDHSSFSSKKNTIKNNDREGIEINAYGANGTITIKKASIHNNGRYGIAKIARTADAVNSFGNVILGSGVNVNKMNLNTFGNISPLVRSFLRENIEER